MNNTPLGIHNVLQKQQQQNKMGFGFAGMPEQYQAQGMMRGIVPEPGPLFQDTDILDLGMQELQVQIDQNKAA